MARGINKVLLIGHLGFDPEALRYTPSGSAVVNLRLATSESWKDKNTGEQQDRTEWHRLVLYGRLAEIAHQYTRKGSKLWIEGRLHTSEWEKDGQKQKTTEIIVNDLQMLDTRGTSDDTNFSPASQKSTGNSKAYNSSYAQQEETDDDIPF